MPGYVFVYVGIGGSRVARNTEQSMRSFRSEFALLVPYGPTYWRLISNLDALKLWREDVLGGLTNPPDVLPNADSPPQCWLPRGKQKQQKHQS